MRILVVEDEEVVRRTMVRVLERQGWGVANCAGGEEALERLAADDIDLVIVDVTLPGLDGVAVADAARAAGFAGRLIIVSGRDLDDGQARRVAAARGDFLRKPFAPQQLLDAVHGREV